ncbi:MAG: hypothetical protein AB7O67_10575 [Vicinamibacterales bacterium]
MAVVASCATAAAQPAPYSIVEIGTLPGATEAYATDINERLQVVGVSGGRPFIWEQGTGMRELPAPGRVQSIRINDAGVMVATCDSGGRQQLCVWQGDALSVLDVPVQGGVTLGKLTDNGILLVQTLQLPATYRQFAIAGGVVYDLNALFGGRIFSLNSHGLVGGLADDGRGFVADLSGTRRSPFPQGVAVEAVGEAGHLAGAPTSGAVLYLAAPDGAVEAIPCECFFPFGSVGDINRNGDFVANLKGISTTTTARVVRQHRLYGPSSLVPGGALSQLFTSFAGITDSGHIAASAPVGAGILPRAVLLVPNLPRAPTGVVASPGARTIGVRWDAVEGAVAYQVEAGTSPGATDVYSGDVGNVTSVTSPIPAGIYYVRVRAISPAGLGPASAEVVFTIP